jgi:hypothetical protein
MPSQELRGETDCYCVASLMYMAGMADRKLAWVLVWALLDAAKQVESYNEWCCEQSCATKYIAAHAHVRFVPWRGTQ